MRISRVSLVEPGENSIYGVTAVSFSWLVFAYSARWGQIAILSYYGLWLSMIFVDYRRVLGPFYRYPWLMAFLAIAFLSVFWSNDPSSSARAFAQYMSHIACALVAARIIDTQTFLRGGLIGSVLVLLYSILFGEYLLDPLDGTVGFIGAFSSKNQLGLYASLGLFVAFSAVFLAKERERIWLAAAAMTVVLAIYCLYAALSATSVITIAAVIMVSLVLQMGMKLMPSNRVVLFVGGGLFFLVAGAAFVYGGGSDLILGLFGKDSTLTGRTYLWQQGMTVWSRNPIFGVGYQAYWRQGSSEPERLWAEFFIDSRQGFHFHNTYIEVAVENGVAGVLSLCAVLYTALFGHLRRLLTRVVDVDSSVMFGLMLLLVIRSFVEIDIIFAYQVGSFLMFFAAVRLTIKHQRSKRKVRLFSAEKNDLVGGSVAVRNWTT